MNAYIIVEGDRTESIVYPAWLDIIAPEISRIDNILEFRDNNYYLFSGGGIPSIYRHIANAAKDINRINAKGDVHIDYLIVCIDTEEETIEYIENRIDQTLAENDVSEISFALKVFEQRVSMESWFLGNQRIFKSNPEDETLRRYINHYNVRIHDPELMDNIDEEEFTTKAQFHHSYLKKLFKERNIKYSKSNPKEVCTEYYLSQIISRYNTTGHIPTFGRWYEFVSENLSNH